MELKSRTPGGFAYATMEDMEPICAKCKQAYFNDYNYLDCYYCPLEATVKATQEYAYRLDKIYD